jgi:hypothetical protein
MLEKGFGENCKHSTFNIHHSTSKWELPGCAVMPGSKSFGQTDVGNVSLRSIAARLLAATTNSSRELVYFKRLAAN